VELKQKCNDHDIFITSYINFAIAKRFNGPLLNNSEFWQHNFQNSKDTFYLLMGPSSKSISLGTICPIIASLMGPKTNCMNKMLIVDHHGLFI
jgi:hypothetical protein